MGAGLAESVLIDQLRAQGVIPPEVKQIPPGGSLIESLLQLQIPEEQLARVLQEQVGIPWTDPARTEADIELLRLIPPDRWWGWQAIPLLLPGDADTRAVALANPLSISTIEAIRQEAEKALGAPVRLSVYAANPRRIQAALVRIFPELRERQTLYAENVARFGEAVRRYYTLPQDEDPLAFVEAMPPEEQERLYANLAREAGLPLLREQVDVDLGRTREVSPPRYLAEYLGVLSLIERMGGRPLIVLLNPYMRDLAERALADTPLRGSLREAEWLLAPPYRWRELFDFVYPDDEFSFDPDEVLAIFDAGEVVSRKTDRPRLRFGSRPPFHRFLIEKGLIDEKLAEEALEAQRGSRVSFEEYLISKEHVDAEALAKALAEYEGIPYVDPATHPPDPTLVDRLSWFSEGYASQHKVFPYRLEDGVLQVLVANPRDYTVLDSLRILSPYRIQPVVATAEAIDRLIAAAFKVGAVEALVDDLAEETSSTEEPPAEEEISESAAVRLVNHLIETAAVEGASDIHIEPREKKSVVRLRIDGALHEQTTFPKGAHGQVVARIKVLARMNLAEKRKPQDGRIVYRSRSGNVNVDLRVSVVPTVYGEKVVMRLLQKAANIPEIEKLGFRPEVLERFKQVISKPYGIILITGPTGSGKSFTTFSVLKRISTPDKNTMTVEDPVEYEIPGINQVQVNPQAGLTFASALRAFLRQDPDIIMVGEIRDSETAKIATEAALTGHLVIATLHTNDAAGAITRLEELGVERFNIAASLLAVLAQRLVRRVCTNCRVPDEPSEEILKALDLKLDALEGRTLYRGEGCERCRGTGYRGRMPIHELLVVDGPVRKAIVEGKSDTEIKEIARREGMYTLREDGIYKALEGYTTLEEVLARTIE